MKPLTVREMFRKIYPTMYEWSLEIEMKAYEKVTGLKPEDLYPVRNKIK